MQLKVSEYNESLHDKWKALTVPQPDADYLCTPVIMRNNGSWAACKSSLELPFSTSYRGDILIVSSGSKHPSVHPPETIIGIVYLYAIAKTESGLFLWQFNDPRKVIPYPAKGQRGKLWSYICPKGEVTPYPRYVKVK